MSPGDTSSTSPDFGVSRRVRTRLHCHSSVSIRITSRITVRSGPAIWVLPVSGSTLRSVRDHGRTRMLLFRPVHVEPFVPRSMVSAYQATGSMMRDRGHRRRWRTLRDLATCATKAWTTTRATNPGRDGERSLFHRESIRWHRFGACAHPAVGQIDFRAKAPVWRSITGAGETVTHRRVMIVRALDAPDHPRECDSPWRCSVQLLDAAAWCNRNRRRSHPDR